MIFDAVLLIGPTGSGKTPLGENLERTGWNGRRCLHFDFGAELRNVDARAGDYPDLSEEERAVVQMVLKDGALLEERHFPIARKILHDFLRRRNVTGEDLLILNGWPRHLGQARDLETIVAVGRIVVLTAPVGTVRERIRTNAGGDRRSREDDSPAEIAKKFALFEERTKPMGEYYAAKGIPVTVLEVAPETSAADLHQFLLQNSADPAIPGRKDKTP